MSSRKTDHDYARHKETVAARDRAESARGRDIGDVPECADPERRANARKSLLSFALAYFPARFPWAFSPNHIKAGERIDRCIDVGGLFALAMERGSGKTTLAEIAVLKAVLYGDRKFVLLIQSVEPLAVQSLKKIQKELESNELLLADFPEVCYPIRMLERIHNRAKGQTSNGKPTRIEWTANGVSLPDVEGSAAAGSVIRTSGITGAIRGLSVSGPNGAIIRPDMVLIDDAQTRDSAKSPTQTSDRESIIADDVLGLAGPGTQIAAVMLCTVIYPTDLSDRFLSPEKHPEWQGMRTAMMESFPTRRELWDEYQEIRRESFRSGDEGKRATEFYRENLDLMNEGARVSWPERMKPNEISAIQSAMNLLLDNPRGFWAEYQNNPQTSDGSVGAKSLTGSECIARLSGVPRHIVPRDGTRLTAFIDPGGEIMWYAIVSFNERFGGSVVDYGTWPRQNRTHFAANDPRPSLKDRFPGRTDEQRVFAGLTELFTEVIAPTYEREAGGTCSIDRCLVDAGWLPSAVYEAIKTHRLSAIISPSKGYARTTTSAGVGEWKRREGERAGEHWRLTKGENTGGLRVAQFDPDHWKTRAFQSLTVPQGGGTALTLFGKKPSEHQLFSEHLESESAEPVTLRGNTFDKWVLRPDRPDNHWFDCLVGSMVAASVAGLNTTANESADPSNMGQPKRVSFREMWEQKNAGKK